MRSLLAAKLSGIETCGDFNAVSERVETVGVAPGPHKSLGAWFRGTRPAILGCGAELSTLRRSALSQSAGIIMAV